MTTYSFPSVVPQLMDWRQIANTAVFNDPLKGTVQTLSRPGTRWACTMQFKALDGDERGELMGFLAKLNGQQHRFNLPDLSNFYRGSGSGSPTVNGGGQTGTSLATQSWSGGNPVIKAGDMFGVNGELKMATADANASAGAATLNFAPALFTSPSNGAAIDITSPTGIFMLAKSEWSRSNINGSASRIYSDFTIEAVEVFT